jgi:hypothetical protein
VPPGGTFGSVSNLVVSLTAVVWDAAQGAYTLRTFERADPQCAALLTQLGRVLITEVTLRVAADYHLRCVSYTDITAAELFAPAGSTGRTLAAASPTPSAASRRSGSSTPTGPGSRCGASPGNAR